jgi:two-component system invasion response regulator UvrY
MSNNIQSDFSIKKISVLLAEDQEIYLSGLLRTVRNLNFISNICTAKNADEVLSVLEYTSFDIIVLGTSIPGIKFTTTPEKILKQHPDSKIIGCGNSTDAFTILTFMQSGGNGFLLKNSPRLDIRKAFLTVLNGKNYFSPPVQEDLNNLMSGDALFSPDKLTFFKSGKLHDLLLLICKEFTLKEIAKELNLSERTVEKYKTQLMKATGTKSTVGLAIYALKNNMV